MRRNCCAPTKASPAGCGGKANQQGLSGEQVPSLVVADRSGQSADFVLERADTRGLGEVLA